MFKQKKIKLVNAEIDHTRSCSHEKLLTQTRATIAPASEAVARKEFSLVVPGVDDGE